MNAPELNNSRYSWPIRVYYEDTDDISLAITREKQMKFWKRAWKIELIEKENPGWEDLSKEWF